MKSFNDFFKNAVMTLVTVIAILLYRDLNEMKGDIKALLAQSNIDKTEIQNLKDWKQSLPAHAPLSDKTPVPEPLFIKYLFIDNNKLQPTKERSNA